MEIRNFQDFVLTLSHYWMDHGCIWSQPYDAQMGAGTFHPHTFLKGIGPEPWRAVYVQPCRRPVDGRYGKSPYRFQHYYQLQVLLKPAPANIIDVFLKSLETVGIKLSENDICLLEDDWKGPTLGAWGLGWEVRANGQEVTQFTYFQQLGGLDVEVVSGEITYGLERLYMYAKGLKNALDMPYNDIFTYGDIYYQNEFEFSFFNFKEANTAELFAHFDLCERNVEMLCEKKLVLPAYDYVLQASHSFNLLDARGAISVSERQRFIGRVRDCAKKCADMYRKERERLGFPMMNRLDSDARKNLYPRGTQEVLQVSNVATATQKSNFSGEVLFELGVEEMPPGFQTSAAEYLETRNADLWKQMKEKFQKDAAFSTLLNKVTHEFFVSSRRIALSWKNIPETEPDQRLEVWGPAERIAKTAEGKLTPAGEGFCRKNGIDSASVLFRDKSDGRFLFAEKNVIGEKLTAKLAQAFKSWMEELPAPLKMRWLPESISPAFIRPVRWILALAGNEVVPVEMFGLRSGSNTFGQRILSPGVIGVENTTAYLPTLRTAHVEPSRKVRREKIETEANRLARGVGGRVRSDEGLLEKCAGLAEDPQVFIGTMDEKYLKLPAALIASVLREHMNYFAVESAQGGLLPHYIGVANYACSKPSEMVQGTHTVVVGRLEDGAFYYDSDLATPLDQFREGLKNQLFQANMGTLWDKTTRVAELSGAVVERVSKFKADSELKAIVHSAALYCKADLKSGCVQEFPDEMQGLMGEILIRTQKPFGEGSEKIAVAVGEHYQPAGANAALPVTIPGRVLSFCDKLDSLCLFFGSGAEVKGNKDPFGLRRLAIGVLRLLGMNENEERLLHCQFPRLSIWALKI